MLRLDNGTVCALIDLDRGMTLRSFTKNGRQVMAEVPWTPREPVPHPDPEQWVAAWAGGWQPALPNAGQPAPRAVVPQCYHGEASQQPWIRTAGDATSVEARWQDAAGLSVLRRLSLEDAGVRLQVSATNGAAEPRPVVVTEHLALGVSALAGGAEIEAPGSTVYPLGAAQERLDGAPWPGTADWSVARVGATPARCAAVTAPAEGVRVRSAEATVRITWDSASLPYFWLWQEIAANPASPWDGKTLALGVEPSTTPHGQGVDVAAPAGECALIGAGATMQWWVRLEIEA